MDGKVFTKSTKELLVKVSSEFFNLPIWLKPFIKPATRLLLNLIEKKLDKVVPDEFDKSINKAINLALTGNTSDSTGVLNELDNSINTLAVPDDESSLSLNSLKVLIGIIKNWVNEIKK